MTGAAYYNEIDPYCAAWLRNLIAAGHIPPGDVDERSIVDVDAVDLIGYRQCHFFAGIGGWGLAARLAGWPDDRPLWTGSCPCQPFSVAGKGAGQADARHLWPDFFRLIAAARPPVVVGEQVAAAVGKSWLDGVCADLEGVGYACGSAVVPACAVDAPHRRDRLWFVADVPRLLERRRKYQEKYGNNGFGLTLGQHVSVLASMWPTPTHRDHFPAHTAAYIAEKKALGHGMSNLSDIEPLGMVPNGFSEPTEKPGALNPKFVSWLMGFPPEWLSCAPSATPSSRKSPRKS